MTDVATAFPLKRLFYRRILPGLFLFLAVLVLLAGTSARTVMRAIYLDQAEARAEVIARAVADDAPRGWAGILAGRPAADIAAGAGGAALARAFANEVRELGLVRLKVYDLTGRVLYSSHTPEIGTLETGTALRQVIATLDPGIVPKTEPDGTELYEFYVPVFDGAGNLVSVFEMYEKTSQLNALVVRAALTAAVPPGLMLVALIAGLAWLVGRAQGDINTRTRALADMKARLETLVSASAIEAARTGEGGSLPSTKQTETIFYSDVRDFSGFADRNPPERVIRFLNELMDIQIRAVQGEGGDVDKMVGDALMARFHGEDAEIRAIAAARAAQEELSHAALARGVGIGIYTGEVVTGAVGPADRRDYTAIGVAVNLAARLCSKARASEIVADAATVARSDAAGFGAAHDVELKGSNASVSIRRLSI